MVQKLSSTKSTKLSVPKQITNHNLEQNLIMPRDIFQSENIIWIVDDAGWIFRVVVAIAVVVVLWLLHDSVIKNQNRNVPIAKLVNNFTKNVHFVSFKRL